MSTSTSIWYPRSKSSWSLSYSTWYEWKALKLFFLSDVVYNPVIKVAGEYSSYSLNLIIIQQWGVFQLKLGYLKSLVVPQPMSVSIVLGLVAGRNWVFLLHIFFILGKFTYFHIENALNALPWNKLTCYSLQQWECLRPWPHMSQTIKYYIYG